MDSMLNTLLSQLWLILLVYPLGPSVAEPDHFDSEALKHRLEEVQLGLYSDLKKCYFEWAFHFQTLAETGYLTTVGTEWLQWMYNSREETFRAGAAETVLNNGAPCPPWPTLRLAQALVCQIGLAWRRSLAR